MATKPFTMKASESPDDYLARIRLADHPHLAHAAAHLVARFGALWKVWKFSSHLDDEEGLFQVNKRSTLSILPHSSAPSLSLTIQNTSLQGHRFDTYGSISSYSEPFKGALMLNGEQATA